MRGKQWGVQVTYSSFIWWHTALSILSIHDSLWASRPARAKGGGMAGISATSCSGGSRVCNILARLMVYTSVFHRCCDHSGDRGADMMGITTEW